VPTKAANLAKGQGGYINLQAENTLILTAFQPMIWIADLLLMKILIIEAP
jgi:hypothetical protein